MGYLLALLSFVILFHKEGFSYVPIRNNPKASYLVTLATRLAALSSLSVKLQIIDLKIVLTYCKVHWHTIMVKSHIVWPPSGTSSSSSGRWSSGKFVYLPAVEQCSDINDP
jgi:hypothetical protein